MRPSLTLFSTAKQKFPWLLGLRVGELQRIARASGIPTKGKRDDLVERIGESLETQLGDRRTNAEFTRTAGAISLLSIDMGIRNLAFAHLRLEKPYTGLDGDRRDVLRPELLAWRRLALSDIASLSENRAGAITRDGGGSSTELSEDEDAGSLTIESASSNVNANGEETSTFSLPHYAEIAHSLLNTLVATYKPTHILIERQRFRTGGSSNVQEWTLRVGVFEAMLYAALQAMKRERGGNLTNVGVYGVDPKRVVQYWGEKEPGFSSVGEGDEKRRPTSREVKKAKMDLAARWLEAELSETTSDTSSDAGGSTAAGDHKIDIPPSAPARSLAEAYVAKFRNPAKRGPTKRGTPRGDVPHAVSKMDDLADCLVQGVTWIEWIRMRELVVRKGVLALEGA